MESGSLLWRVNSDGSERGLENRWYFRGMGIGTSSLRHLKQRSIHMNKFLKYIADIIGILSVAGGLLAIAYRVYLNNL